MGPVVDSKRRSVLQQALALGRDSLFFESPSSNALVFTDYFRCGPSWYLKNLRVMMDYPTEERIASVAAPVLVLRGANDPVASADWCRRLAARAARGRLVEIQGTGHVLQHNRAAEVAGAILAFAGTHAAAEDCAGEPGMSGVLEVARWWVQDYLYAAGRQILSAASRTRPEDFLSGAGRPVVVIPGVYEDWRFMLPMVRRLHEAGHPVHVLALLHRNRLAVPKAADLISGYIRDRDLTNVMIVAHSKGGLIGKFVMMQLDPERRIAGMVAVCSPFSGSRYASFMLLPSLRAFSPRSAVTMQLSREERVNERITSVYGQLRPAHP